MWADPDIRIKIGYPEISGLVPELGKNVRNLSALPEILKIFACGPEKEEIWLIDQSIHNCS